MIIYDKLVRDLIPQILKQKGVGFSSHIADEVEYKRKLDEKLVEEVGEYQESGEVEELADILEVVYTIAENKGVSIEELEKIRERKANERGKFLDKIILETTD